MKTAHQWFKDCEGFDGITRIGVNHIKEIQKEALNAGVQVAIDYMVGHYWGHEIIRAAVYHLCATNGLPMPKVPFAPERLHPGANQPEVAPKAVEVPLQGKVVPAQYVPERVWTMDPLGPEPSPPSAHPNPKTSSLPPCSPPSPLHPAGACPPCADPPVPDAAAWEGTSPKAPEPPIEEIALRRAQAQFSETKRELRADFQRQQKEREELRSAPSSLEQLVTDVCERFEAAERRLEALEANSKRLLEQNSKRAEHLAKTGEYLHHAYLRIEALEKLAAELARADYLRMVDRRVTELEQWKNANQEVYEKLAKQNLTLIEALARPSPDPDRPVFELAAGYSLSPAVAKVRGVELLWNGSKWLVSW